MTQEAPIKTAIEQVRQNDLAGARLTLQISEALGDAELIDSIMNLEKGLKLFFSQETVAAMEPLKNGSILFRYSEDETTKFLIQNLINFSEGIAKLFSGDNHGAKNLLNLSSRAWEELSFYFPEFEINKLCAEAASCIADAKTYMGIGDMASAEKAVATHKSIHEKLLGKLDKNNPEHIQFFVEIYGTRLEFAIAFITSLDMPVLDLGLMNERIKDAKNDTKQLAKVLPKMQDGEIKSLIKTLISIFSIVESVAIYLDVVLLQHRPFNKSEVTRLTNLEGEIFTARKSAMNCGSRKNGVLMICDQISRLHANLLKAGRASKSDFGRLSGTISLIAFMVLFPTVHFLITPEGKENILYFVVILTFSLIVGFGYGALKFIPFFELWKKFFN